MGKDLNNFWRWRNVYSVYVANLPQGISAIKVQNLFSCYGKIVDVYIPKKAHFGNSICYAFVRFEFWNDAKRAIEYLNNWFYMGYCLTVRMAKFPGVYNLSDGLLHTVGKTESQLGVLKKDNVGGVSCLGTREMLINGCADNHNLSLEVLKGDKELLWLDGCAVAELANWNMSIADILRSMELEKISNCEVKYLGDLLYLLQFPNQVERDFTLMEFDDWICGMFTSTRPWGEDVGSNRRMTWIRCYGIPLHVWNENFFNQLCASFGSLIKIDKNTGEKKFLEYGRLLVLSSDMDVIRRKISIKVDDKIYQIFIFEESSEVNGNSMKMSAEVNPKQFVDEGICRVSGGSVEGILSDPLKASAVIRGEICEPREVVGISSEKPSGQSISPQCASDYLELDEHLQTDCAGDVNAMGRNLGDKTCMFDAYLYKDPGFDCSEKMDNQLKVSSIFIKSKEYNMSISEAAGKELISVKGPVISEPEKIEATAEGASGFLGSIEKVGKSGSSVLIHEGLVYKARLQKKPVVRPKKHMRKGKLKNVGQKSLERLISPELNKPSESRDQGRELLNFFRM